MARVSYLTRRDGRYSIQIRFPVSLARHIGHPLYRASLRTSDYRTAKARLNECLAWFQHMNDVIDYPHLFALNVRELRMYLADQWPIGEDRLFARKQYEELLKNLVRRAEAHDFAPDMLEPDFPDLFKHFVRQNVEAEAHERKIEKVRAYERGRSDIQSAMEAGARPASFAVKGAELANTFQAPFADRGPAPHFRDALDEYIAEKRREGSSGDLINDVRLVIEFLIDRLGNIRTDTFDAAMTEKLDMMLPDIPDRKGIPRGQCKSLSARYDYAQKNGWSNLKRLTKARLVNGYHNSLSKFFAWLIQKSYYPHKKPIFRQVSGKNLVSLPRDAFQYEEIVSIFSQPLFTGCETPKRIWKPGTFFIQSHLYWAYVLLVLHGLRIGEVGQLSISDLIVRQGIHYIDLRAFDPQKGRVALEDVKDFKTPSSERLIPLHPLALELGLLERAKDLKGCGCPVLFPEWEPYRKPSGDLRWGQPLTKSWQYLKKKVGITRADVSAYSTRHLFADFVDQTSMSHRSRMRIMGHSTKREMSTRYGNKQRFSTKDLREITTLQAPEILFMTERLLAAKQEADSGKLKVVKPWLSVKNWSQHYRQE